VKTEAKNYFTQINNLDKVISYDDFTHDMGMCNEQKLHVISIF